MREQLSISISVRISLRNGNPISPNISDRLACAQRETSLLGYHSRGIRFWRLKVKTTCTPAHRTKSNGRMAGSIPFASTCPKCAQVQPQPGYDGNSLPRLLNGGYPVEAYCPDCDAFLVNQPQGALGARRGSDRRRRQPDMLTPSPFLSARLSTVIITARECGKAYSAGALRLPSRNPGAPPLRPQGKECSLRTGVGRPASLHCRR